MNTAIAEVLTDVDKQLRMPVCAYLRRAFPGLSHEDLADTWAESIAALYSRLLSKQELMAGQLTLQSLAPLVRTIAVRRAIDRLRQKSRDANALFLAAREIKPLTDVTDNDRIRDLLKKVSEITETLPEKQKAVLTVFINGYPETENMETLCRAVIEATGVETNVGAVKRNLHEAREKIRALVSEID